MTFVPVLHAEWIKIRTLRSLLTSLAAILAATAAFSALASLDPGEGTDFDPLFSAFFGVSFGQIAAVAFGTTAVAAEFHGGALRVTLAAVPRRGRWFAAKATVVALPTLAVGLVTGLVTAVVGRAVLGDRAADVTVGQELRAAVGCGIYLMLMALLAAGLTALLRSGVATLSILVPFLLLVSFVIGDVSGGLAGLLPDRAGQTVLHQSPDGQLGPWTGLAVAAVWAAAALAGGAWRVVRRDA